MKLLNVMKAMIAMK